MPPSEPTGESDETARGAGASRGEGPSGPAGGPDGPSESPGPARPAPEAGAPSGAGEPDPAARDRPLPEDVETFLVELASALQKHAMYPEEHPALELAVDELLERLQGLLADRPNVMVTGRKGRLFVDGGSSEPDQPLLSSLAGRLHAQQVLSVTFRRGTGLRELRSFLSRLSEEVDRGGEPLGLASKEVLKAWSHIDVQPLRYDPLETGEREEGLEAEDAWQEELRGEYDTEIAGADLLDASPEAMARNVEREMGEDVRDRMVAVQLFRLAEQLSNARGRAARRLRQRMSQMILSLDAETLERLLELGREGGREDPFLVDAADALDTEAVVELIQAAAAGGERDIAQPLLRLLTKLSMYAENDPELAADAEEGAMRNLVRSLVDDWSLEDPNPQAYDSFLEQMSHRPPAAGAGDAEGESPVEPDRMLKMGIELEEWSPAVRSAGQRLIDEDRIDEVIDLLLDADEGNRVRDAMWDRIARPEVVKRLLRRDTPPWGLLERIVERAGTAVADPLLEVLALAGSRSVRRRSFGLLTSMGSELGDRVMPYLEDDRWFVRRNMLALMAEVDDWPEAFSPREHMTDDEARVRAEAIKAGLSHPEHREAALRLGLEDDDDRVLSLALAGAEEGAPEDVEPLLVEHATDRSLSDPLRTTAVRALAGRGTARARDGLLRVVWVRHWFFWRRLADGSPPVRAALSELASRWPDHPRVEKAAREAAGADDAKLREAAVAHPALAGQPPGDEPEAADGDGAPEEAGGDGPAQRIDPGPTPGDGPAGGDGPADGAGPGNAERSGVEAVDDAHPAGSGTGGAS